MRIKLYALIGLLFLFGVQPVRSGPQEKNYYFRSLGIGEGLSQNTVNAILQDHFGFLWFGTKDGLNRYDGLNFHIFKHNADDARSLGNNFITALYEDKNYRLWVGTDAGLYIYNQETEAFGRFDMKNPDGISIEKAVNTIYGDAYGRIWITVEEQGLFCYRIDDRTLEHYSLDYLHSDTNVRSVCVDNGGTVWIGFYGGGLHYSKDNLVSLYPFVCQGEEVFRDDVITKLTLGAYNYLYVGSVKHGLQGINITSWQVDRMIEADERGEDVFVRDIMAFSNNELWIGTETGIYIYNLRTREYTHLYNVPGDTYSLSDNAVYNLCRDREGGVWIGTYFGGVNYIPLQYTYFEKFYPRNGRNSMHGKRVREFCQGNDGTLWIGTEDGGLNHYNPQTRRFRFFEPSDAFKNVHGLCIDGDFLWVGTFSKGLKKVDTRTGAVVRSYYKGSNPNSLCDNSVFTICKTMSGDLYFGTLFGLYRYNRSSDDFIRISELNGRFIYDIKEDSYGNLWLATYANGAYRYDVAKREWINYTYAPEDTSGIPSNKVLSIFEDSRRQVWLTTQGGGFCRYNPESDNFTCFDSRKGLPNDVVYQIIEDDDGLFWISTNSGLIRFNPREFGIRVFTKANGLPVNQFNYRSGCKTSDGTIYMGSIEGFIAFNPRSFIENRYIPPVVITDFLVFNKRAVVGEKDSPLDRSIIYSDRVTLKASQNSFSVRVAALSYQAPDMNQIVYKLEGFDNEWYTRPANANITYSNLRHGEYLLRIKASNSDGVWNETPAELRIRILPPFYLSVWAYILYFVFTAALLFYAAYYLRRRSRIRLIRQREKFEQEKEREIYTAKIDFFTNIAHEIRTPLTLIKGPLDHILHSDKMVPDLKEDMAVMSQNTDRLLDLTNQLLDFRKTETNGFRLNFVHCNVSEVIRNTYHRFSSLSKQKGLKVTLELPDTDFYADVDKEAFTKIISNLFNNAVKYSDTYIRVFLSSENVQQTEYFVLRMQNDGLLVPQDQQERIFEPFIQYARNGSDKVTGGTGIGLALARSLAELHSGSLKLETVPDCNSFRLMLPVAQENIIVLADPLPVTESDEARSGAAEKISGDYTVLVVEDNPDMRAFIVRQLTDVYTVLTAANGIKALEVLDNNYVSLVISDVVMPEMDGFELCKMLKSKVNYSHIPIVLLTAKTNLQSKIAGMELGADAYIEKPFSTGYLLACVANLIRTREKLRETFANSPFVAANTMAMTKADEEFLRKLNEIIEANLHDPEFSLDDMAETLNMSRSSFYRKIKGVLDMTPNDYLRLERLKKAAQLLQEGKNRVNEICYQVGFSSPSYFAKCFQKQFGVRPREFTE